MTLKSALLVLGLTSLNLQKRLFFGIISIEERQRNAVDAAVEFPALRLGRLLVYFVVSSSRAVLCVAYAGKWPL